MSQPPARENDSVTRLRATAAHTIPERPPIRVTPGQRVQAGQRDTDWPAFVFITTDDGAGWVPGRHLDTSADPAVVITAYETTELATIAGEELTLIRQDDPSGWAWVRNLSGHGRLSFPFFLDPGFAADVPPLPDRAAAGDDGRRRWDGQDLRAFNGTYGDYLLGKVSKVFPQLRRDVLE